jgi:hypothetical protein
MKRVHTYPITKQAQEKELNIINDTLHNNEYNINLGARHPKQQKYNRNTDPQHQKTKWTIFTYSVKKQRKLQNSLKKHK